MISVNSAVGIDVAKDECVACLLPEGRYFTFKNDSKGIREFVRNLKKLKPEQIILKPTGGYERQLAHALEDDGFDTHFL